MTEDQFNCRFAVLLLEVNKKILARAEFLLKSGAIDVAAFEDNYALPKIVMCNALKEQSDKYYPIMEYHKRYVKNLEAF